MRRLYLASRSPARLKMLWDAGLDVEPCATRADEAALKRELAASGASARGIAEGLAAAKAMGVEAPAGLILGADQTLEIDGETLDKPANLDALRLQLQRLSGRTHHLHSAATFVDEGRVLWQGVSSVALHVRPLARSVLDRYIATEGEHVLDCVGGYRFEGPGIQLFDAVEGDYFAVLGLPLLAVLRALRELGALS